MPALLPPWGTVGFKAPSPSPRRRVACGVPRAGILSLEKTKLFPTSPGWRIQPYHLCNAASWPLGKNFGNRFSDFL
jgi:hypothetical protein